IFPRLRTLCFPLQHDALRRALAPPPAENFHRAIRSRRNGQERRARRLPSAARRDRSRSGPAPLPPPPAPPPIRPPPPTAPPPPPTCETSSTGTATGTPAAVDSLVVRNSPESSATPVDAPPMSNVMPFSTPASFAA